MGPRRPISRVSLCPSRELPESELRVHDRSGRRGGWLAQPSPPRSSRRSILPYVSWVLWCWIVLSYNVPVPSVLYPMCKTALGGQRALTSVWLWGGGRRRAASRRDRARPARAYIYRIEPWLPGCRVLPDRVAGLPGCCRVSAGLPGAGCCRGVLPGALPGCEDVRTLPSGCCRVLPGAAGLPGCRVAGCCRVAGLCCRGSCRAVCCLNCRIAHHETHLRERSLSDW